MALVNQPAILSGAFAAEGDKNTIPANNDGLSGLASIAKGFPPITQVPLAQGGQPPQRQDFNGIFNLFSQFLLYAQNGGVYEYNNTLDYQPPCIISYDGEFYSCVAENGPSTSAGTQEPTIEQYWKKLIPEISSASIVDMVYPVGSIYMSTNAANPSTLWPGTTWEAYAQGRVLIGAGTGTDSRSEKKTFAAGSTGGEYNHQLTVGEMPTHSHTVRSSTNTTGSHSHTIRCFSGSNTGQDMIYESLRNNRVGYSNFNWINSAGNHSHTITATASNSGNSAAHSLMQPFIVAYIWRRTA